MGCDEFDMLKTRSYKKLIDLGRNTFLERHDRYHGNFGRKNNKYSGIMPRYMHTI